MRWGMQDDWGTTWSWLIYGKIRLEGLKKNMKIQSGFPISVLKSRPAEREGVLTTALGYSFISVQWHPKYWIIWSILSDARQGLLNSTIWISFKGVRAPRERALRRHPALSQSRVGRAPGSWAGHSLPDFRCNWTEGDIPEGCVIIFSPYAHMGFSTPKWDAYPAGKQLWK